MTPGNTIHAIASSVSMKLVSSAESDADHGRGSTIEFGGHGSSTNTYAADDIQLILHVKYLG